uniref:Uncharacterized protein n=1 Tax=Clytia hemisphaerica TaxID=252671 RepID=A0A7M5XED0_9CNID|eukprot:TCONS_00008116-protein
MDSSFSSTTKDFQDLRWRTHRNPNYFDMKILREQVSFARDHYSTNQRRSALFEPICKYGKTKQIEENTKVIEIESKMPLSFGKRSAYKQFQNTSIISHQKNTAQTPSTQSSHLKSVEIVKSPPGCSFFTARKTAPQRQQEFIKAINVLYGSERRVRNSPLSGK